MPEASFVKVLIKFESPEKVTAFVPALRVRFLQYRSGLKVKDEALFIITVPGIAEASPRVIVFVNILSDVNSEG